MNETTCITHEELAMHQSVNRIISAVAVRASDVVTFQRFCQTSIAYGKNGKSAKGGRALKFDKKLLSDEHKGTKTRFTSSKELDERASFVRNVFKSRFETINFKQPQLSYFEKYGTCTKKMKTDVGTDVTNTHGDIAVDDDMADAKPELEPEPEAQAQESEIEAQESEIEAQESEIEAQEGEIEAQEAQESEIEAQEAQEIEAQPEQEIEAQPEQEEAEAQPEAQAQAMEAQAEAMEAHAQAMEAQADVLASGCVV
jgi:hypothetical protein